MSARSLNELRREWLGGSVALRTIVNFLHNENLTLKAQALFMDYTEAPQRSVLPSFNPFDVSEGVRAGLWSVPTPKDDFTEVVAGYEAYTDRQLGAVRRPEQIARTLVWKPSSIWFGPRRTQYDWWVPAVQIVALANRFADVDVEVAQGRVCLEAHGKKLLVTPSGCWVPWRERMVKAVFPAQDADIGLLTIPPLITYHPLAAALLKLQAPLYLLWAGNTLVRALQQGKMAPLRMQSLERPSHKFPLRGKRKSKNPRDVMGSLESAREVLEGGTPETLWDIYKTLVPYAVTAAEFREAVCNPFDQGGRVITPVVRERVAALIDSVERTLQGAEM